MSRYDEWLFMQQQILAGQAVPGMHLSGPPSRRESPDLRVAIAQADTIVAHPGWQYFLNALEARVREIQGRLNMYQEKLMEHEDAGIRRKTALLQGELTGLKFAATLVPQIVSMGEHGQGRARGISESTEERADQASASGSQSPGS